jgi:hypothetical protein
MAGAVLFIAVAQLGSAQTVRPLIDENRVSAPGKVAKGRIEYYNDSLDSLFVTLEAKSFSVSETGELSYRPLDNKIHLKLSSMSFRVPPQQSFYVFYEASADEIPAWFVVYGTFSGFKARTQEGFKIQIQLPHTIYILPKREVEKSELTITRAEFNPTTKKVLLRVQNSGPAFGRVLETDITSGKNQIAQDGFPVFPNAPRQIEIAWPSDDVPSKLKIQLENFSLEHQVQSLAP